MKKLLILLAVIAAVRGAGLYSVKYIHETGVTNNESKVVEIPEIPQSVVPADKWQWHEYMSRGHTGSEYLAKYYVVAQQYGELDGMIPVDFVNDPCFQFTWNGIKKRKGIYEYIIYYSHKFGVNHNFVLASIMGEQLRIGCNTSKQHIKQTIKSVSPTWFISYDFSLGVGGVKPSTAWYIINSMDYYGYYPNVRGNADMENCLTEIDYCQAFFPTAIVDKIANDWNTYDPGIIGTIYNIGIQRREPHDSPQVGGSIIRIGGHEVTYGEIVGMLFYQLELRG